MGTKRLGLARVEALMENLKREIDEEKNNLLIEKEEINNLINKVDKDKIELKIMSKNLAEEQAEAAQPTYDAIPVEPESDKKFYQKPLFWVGVGVVGVAAFFAIKKLKGNGGSINNIQ